MGKSRRSRGGASQRRDPIAKPVKAPSDPELAALRETKILPIVQDLKNSDPKSRSAAATAIANLIQDKKCRKLLLREHIVHTILTQTLCDNALESRAAGWGILQVLAQEEDADFCVHLFRSDIITAIQFAAQTVGEKLLSQTAPFPKLPKLERALTISITASLIALTMALIDAGDDILVVISSNSIIADLLLLPIVSSDDGGSDSLLNLRGDALTCLMMLTEDNGDLAQRLVANTECFQALQTLKNHATGAGVLACAILHNIFASLESLENPPQVPAADDSLLIPTLANVILTAQPAQGTTNGNPDSANNPAHQQLALETLASIGMSLSSNPDDAASAAEQEAAHSKDDHDMNDAEDDARSVTAAEGAESGDDDDDEMDEDEIQADMDVVLGPEDDIIDDNIDDEPVLKAFIQDAIPPLIRIATFPPNDQDPFRLREHALSALNNIAWSVSFADFSDVENAGILKAWTPVARTIWTSVVTPILTTDTTDIDLATVLTGLAWAIVRSLGSVLTPLDGTEHHKFMSLYHATQSTDTTSPDTVAAPQDPFQRLSVKCIGVLGQLALPSAPMSLNRSVGTFLVTLLTKLPETPAADAVEALNQLFEIYADEDNPCDAEVFWKDNLYGHLVEALPKVRTMAKAVNKKVFPEVKTRADEAVFNLSRFLAYKKKNKPRPVNKPS